MNVLHGLKQKTKVIKTVNRDSILISCFFKIVREKKIITKKHQKKTVTGTTWSQQSQAEQVMKMEILHLKKHSRLIV